MFKNIFSIVFLTFINFSIFAQADWNYFTKKDSLTDEYISFIEKDRNGVIWIGSDQGLATFDGEKIKPILKKIKIRAIVFDKYNYPWISGNDSLNNNFVKYFDGNNWNSVSAKNDSTPYNLNVFTMKKDDQNNLWFITNSLDFYKYDTI